MNIVHKVQTKVQSKNDEKLKEKKLKNRKCN